jgi:hypothetical protein
VGLTSLWRRPSSKDPYWDAFINKPPLDANNLVPPAIRSAVDGQVFPVKAETHTPEVMAEHIKALGRFLGADLVGIANRDPVDADDYPFAIVCAVRSEYDPRTSPGIGGQAAALTGAFVTFSLAAAIREFGYRATRSDEADIDQIAASAGLGTLDSEGRLVTGEFGRAVHLAGVVLTDLPLNPNSAEV